MTKDNFYIKKASKSDYNFFYSLEEQKERHVVAFILMNEKKRIAIGGFFLRERGMLAFIKLNKVCKIPSKTLFKIVKKNLHQITREITDPVYAIRDTTIKNSDIFLQKLGFKHLTTLNNEELYKL